MQKVYPTDRVPNMQAFPESGYPIAAYYGVDTTLADIQANTPSSGALQAAAMKPSEKTRMVFTILGIIFVSYAVFHWYNK